MKKPFLLLQIRPEDVASDNEYQAFLQFSGLEESRLKRWRLDQHPDVSTIKLQDYAAIIVGGGPACISTNQADKPEYQQLFEASLLPLMTQIIESDTPFFGACYGIGLLAKALGAEVSKNNYSEPVGAVTIQLESHASQLSILEGIDSSFQAFAGHKEAVQAIPNRSVNLAKSTTCPVQFLKVKNNIYATQFHPELDVPGIVTRIGVYKNAGYFPPEEAEALITKCQATTVSEPVKILKNFCKIYG